MSEDHWKVRGFDLKDSYSDEIKLTYELDIHAYTSKLLKGMAEAEDEVAEPVVVDWLRKRGWTVERK